MGSVLPLSEDLFPQTQKVLKEAVQAGVAPGFVAGLWEGRNPDTFYLSAHGQRRVVPSSLPMLPETIFDFASITKVFGTATLAALLVERGWIRWDSKVKTFFPEFPYPEISLKHLLSHTAGYPAWQPLWQKIQAEFESVQGRKKIPLYRIPVADRQQAMKRLVLAAQPERPPEQAAVYSDLSFILLGFVLEEATQSPLDQIVPRALWRPMGISQATYRRVTQSVLEGRDERVAATELCPWRNEVLQGQVHDENCWAMGGYAGHAGAFGTAQDLLIFARELLQGFLSRPVLRAMWTRVQAPPGCERTLGWDTPSREGSSAGRLFSPRSVGHLGFTGTSLWIDLEEEVVAVLLSNRVHPTREDTPHTKIKAFRPIFHEALRYDLRR